jgi:hypothetical protein
MLIFTTERIPLGMWAQYMRAGDPNDTGKHGLRQQLRVSQREIPKWLTNLEALCRAREYGEHTRFVSVGHRSADLFDLLAAERSRRC